LGRRWTRDLVKKILQRRESGEDEKARRIGRERGRVNCLGSCTALNNWKYKEAKKRKTIESCGDSRLHLRRV
jgi:hypothetical protein